MPSCRCSLAALRRWVSCCRSCTCTVCPRVTSSWRCVVFWARERRCRCLRSLVCGTSGIVEYNAWSTRRLDDRELVYAWADGIYIKAGLEKEKAALLVVIGAMSDGRKEILAIVPGYRESTASWTDVLRDRGLAVPVLLAADGHLGIWTAVAEIWPHTAEQRCWNHRILNVLNKLPKSAGTAHADPLRAHPSRSEETSRSIRQTLSRAVPRRRGAARARFGTAW